jgi:hypothetical protein
MANVPIQPLKVVWLMSQSNLPELYGLRTRVVRGFLPLELYGLWTGVVRDGVLPLQLYGFQTGVV